MAVNKVIYYGEVLVDMSRVSVKPEKLVEGETALDASGELITGNNPYEKTATNMEVDAQSDLLDQAIAALQGKAAGGGGDGGDVDKLLNKTITEVSSTATTIDVYAFNNCAQLTSANIPNAKTIGNYAFNNCSKLKSAIFPNVTSVGNYAFSGCSSIENVDFTNLTSVGTYTFNSCSKLKNAVFPNVTSIANYAFQSSSALVSADFPKATSIGTYAFRYGYLLKAVILRSNVVCSLSNTNAFSNCHHYEGTKHNSYNPTGAKDGYIYVPRALVDAYKSATNWTTYASQIRALEDYTVDGTIMGALDENKI